MAIQYSQFSSPLSRNARKPSVVINDGSWNPNDTVDYATGQNLIPTWNMPDVGGYTAPAQPVRQTIDYTEGLPSWTMPNITPTPTSTDTSNVPAVDSSYADADRGSVGTTMNRVEPVYPFETWFGKEVGRQMGYIDKNIWNSMTPEQRDQWRATAYNKYLASLNTDQTVPDTGTGGSSVNAEYATALRDYIAGIQGSGLDYGKLIEEAQARYGGYGDTLTADVAAATAKQQAAAQQARQALLGLMPTTVSNVTPANLGAGTATGYLQNIGASTRDVDAVRAMEQQMLNQSLASTQAYTQRLAAVDEANRMAQQAAVETILQEASSGLATNEQAQRRQYAEALAAEVERLRAAEQAQQNNLANMLLEARLMAAQSGVAV